jgi:hypothetical protein
MNVQMRHAAIARVSTLGDDVTCRHAISQRNLEAPPAKVCVDEMRTILEAKYYVVSEKERRRPKRSNEPFDSQVQ